ncbi:hypothetical protein chiPu_0030221, partial [Chiloscyllium punctatum]|nr:hypothetical protein [Chiloscyllium punctatum]
DPAANPAPVERGSTQRHRHTPGDRDLPGRADPRPPDTGTPRTERTRLQWSGDRPGDRDLPGRADPDPGPRGQSDPGSRVDPTMTDTLRTSGHSTSPSGDSSHFRKVSGPGIGGIPGFRD